MSGLPVRVQGLTQVYETDGERVTALSDVDFSVPAGGLLTVAGPSGSGKSTLLAVLAGLQRPTAGSVRIGEEELATLPERQLLALRRRHLSIVVQDPRRNLLSYGTAVDNVRFAQRPVARARRRDPRELLGRLGLERLADAPVDRLSGGERQRVAIATGLAVDPGVLLVDEPTSALDARSRDDVLDLLDRQVRGSGSTMLVITHDPEVERRLGGVLRLDGGRVVAS